MLLCSPEIQIFITVSLWEVPLSPLQESPAQPSHAVVRGSGTGSKFHLFFPTPTPDIKGEKGLYQRYPREKAKDRAPKL